MALIALLGNPNCGKTTLFNAFTGMRQATANYPGVTVEKKHGFMFSDRTDEWAAVLDLPGTYSLLPRSLDEEISWRVLIGLQEGVALPDAVVIVLDALALERSLYLAQQVIETGHKVFVAVNMWDMAQERGIKIDLKMLERELGVPCYKTIARKKEGVAELKEAVLARTSSDARNEKQFIPVSVKTKNNLKNLSESISSLFPHLTKEILFAETLRTVLAPEGLSFGMPARIFGRQEGVLANARRELKAEGLGFGWEPEQRYKVIDSICENVVSKTNKTEKSFSDRLDNVLTHKVWGITIFVLVMGVIFQSIFTWATIPMELISNGVDFISSLVKQWFPDGQLKNLISDGVIAGVGNVIVFVPQIFLLFFFIAFLEDLGYMARAAFVLDRLMKKSGLNGRAFLPLLSSFACAVPAIMSTRIIPNQKDRLTTILIAPLMSCSARLPVYTLMIGAFIPAIAFLGFVNLRGVVLFSMYSLSLMAGLIMALLLRKGVFKGDESSFVFELPPYRMPDLKIVLLTTWDKLKEFIIRAGSIILMISVVLWFILSHPQDTNIKQEFDQKRAQVQTQLSGDELQMSLKKINYEESGALLRKSYAGQIGHWIEPIIRPLGYDWKIGIGLVASFAAREALVSTFAIIYNVGHGDDAQGQDLIQALRTEQDSQTGQAVYSPAVALSIMVFFVLACQCMSTIAIVKRETGGWRWPIFMVVYMSALAWVGAFMTFQLASRMGWGG